MRLYAICLLLAAGLLAPPSVAQTTPVTLPHSREFSLHSSATQRDYLIQVAIPDQPPPAQGITYFMCSMAMPIGRYCVPPTNSSAATDVEAKRHPC